MDEARPHTAARLYREHVAEVERLWKVIQDQRAMHEQAVKANFAKRWPTIEGTTQALVVDRRCTQDPVIASARSGMDRNLQFAIMYGLGALLEVRDG